MSRRAKIFQDPRNTDQRTVRLVADGRHPIAVTVVDRQHGRLRVDVEAERRGAPRGAGPLDGIGWHTHDPALLASREINS
jgi:hypothetical protein